LDIRFTTRVFKEGRTYIAHALELDISSCGGSKEKAVKNLKEAVRLFLEEAEKMGTLELILEEAGYSKRNMNLRALSSSACSASLFRFRQRGKSKFNPVSYQQLAKVFEAEGFTCVRTTGDHMVFTKRGVKLPVVIPKYSAVPIFIIRSNLRTAEAISAPPAFHAIVISSSSELNESHAWAALDAAICCEASSGNKCG
jgi:predicted RNA binding protein YcfA (HicA-like mRNA interferase family)